MKLSPISILLIGVALALIALSYGIFQQYMPNMADVASYEKNTELQNAEAAHQKEAERRVKKAIAMVQAKDTIWKGFVASRTPTGTVSTGGINLAENAYQLGIDTYTFRDSIQSAVNAQLRKGNVKILSAPTIQMPDPNGPVNSILTSFYNYPAIPFPVVIFDLGQITVQGSYDQIMNHVRAYKDMPHYLAVTDGLALSGTSPNLIGTYNLSIVGFIRGKSVYPPVPEAAAASGGGFGGGFGGGMPGMPGGGPRGAPGGPPGMSTFGGGKGMG